MKDELKAYIERRKIEGQWLSFFVNDITEISLKIRPLYLEVWILINDLYKIPKKKKHWKIADMDWIGLRDESIDYLLEDFRGFGTDRETPMENTIENKKKILGFEFQWNGKHIVDFIFEKGTELAGVNSGLIERHKGLITLTEMKKSYKLMEKIFWRGMK